jgi:hypothetical protein
LEEGKRAANILQAEVIGQVAYYQRHKRYVRRQKDFVLQYLKNPDIALAGNF